jgi:PIN domain nuclease of toxin-antitoxin system
MRLLLDTHTFLWFISGNAQLSNKARELISDPENDILLSVASLWEIVIKMGLGKLRLAGPFEDVIPRQIDSNEFETLGIELPHLTELIRLPQHHRDPFDRLIIAQAIAEGTPLLARDEAFKDYPNTALFFSANEVINDIDTGEFNPPYIRAVTRDLKEYIKKHVSRPIPVGYSAADVRDNLLDSWNYFRMYILVLSRGL